MPAPHEPWPRSTSALLEQAKAAMAGLASLDLDEVVAGQELTDCVLAMQELRGALDTAEARVLARWDSSGEWRVDGAKTASAWLAWKQRIPIAVARQRLRHGRALRDLPLVEKAWAAGEIDRAHVSTLLGVRTERTKEAFDHDHETLLQGAMTVGFIDFKAILELDRTPAQRRADALVEMAIRARTAPRDGRRPAPLFSVLVGYETFAGPLLELLNRTVITPGTATRWLTEGDIERVVFDGPSRVIDVGATRRFFRGALKHAIEIRDRRCFHPSCDETPLFPEIDHIQPASQGGPTTQQNGRLGCGFHNRWRNHHPDHEHDQGTLDLGDPDACPDPPEHE